MSDWPEFVSGEGYSVDLRDISTDGVVTVRLVEKNENCYVLIVSPVLNKLFDKVAGRVIYALAANSGHVMVTRRDTEPAR